MWSTWQTSLNQALEKTNEALERTGDVLSKAATQAGQRARQNTAAATPNDEAIVFEGGQEYTGTVVRKSDSKEGAAATDENTDAAKKTLQNLNEQKSRVFQNLSAGWSTVLESTKASIQTAQKVVEQEQSKLKSRFKTAYYSRDLSLPLDVPALQDAQVVYLTDRIITMSHPALDSPYDKSITGERKLAAVGHLLQKRHEGKYMVWNLSEVDYDPLILNDQVLTFSFPGSPSPPLGLLLKLLMSLESWLKADERNVAVVHCLTGKGRTSTVVAAFLCWMGEAGFGSLPQALEYIAACKQVPPDDLTIPSQRRYVSYFQNMLDGVRPSQPPLRLLRVILSEAPKYAKGPSRTDAENESTDELQLWGCAPYLQLFKAGKLLHTVPASLHYQQSPDELPFCQVADGHVSFHVNQIIQGDILIRCRHLTAKKQRVSMFRAALHTGYVPPKVIRLTKAQLDGACNDDRFPDDFYVDLILESVDVDEASGLLDTDEDAKEGSPKNEKSEAEKKIVSATAYDSMLHRDSRFWDVITARKKEHDNKDDTTGETLSGPTVGRRRQLEEESQDAAASESTSTATPAATSAFSIGGGELDFLPSASTEVAMSEEAATDKVTAKKDTLMEALMGALDDDDDDTHEIVFDNSNEDKEPAATIVQLPPVASGDTETDTTTNDDSAQTTEVKNDETSNEINELLNFDNDDDDDLLNAAGNDDDDDDMLDLGDDDLEELENFLSPNKK